MKKSEASSSFGRSVTDDATDNFLDGVNIQFRSLHQIKTENRRVKRQNEKLSKEIEELTKKYKDLTKKYEDLTKKYDNLNKRWKQDQAKLKNKMEDLAKLKKEMEDMGEEKRRLHQRIIQLQNKPCCVIL